MKSIPTISVEALLKEREELLKSDPWLVDLQNEIDLLMNSLPDDPALKIQIMNKILIQTVNNELIPSLIKLIDLLSPLQEDLLKKVH